MKILYDHQSFTGSKYGGVARYFYDLMYTLKHQSNAEVELSVVFSNNAYLQNADVKTVFPFKNYLGKGVTNKIFSHLNRANSALKLIVKDFDVFHPTYFNDYFLDYIGKKPFVITHHDVIPEKFSQKYAELDGFDINHKQKLLDRASKVIAVSENTKKDLLEYFKISEDKIEVVHHATHFSIYKPDESFDIKTPDNYLLYVGNRDNYKNFDFFVKSIAPLFDKFPDLYLICAGSGNFNDYEHRLLADLQISDKVLYYPITSDDLLYRLYQKALGFVYPSLYEGFGIPILEAYACGCPVAISDRSSFPEVAKNAAIYFNPNDSEHIQHAIEQLIEDTQLRLNLVKKGYDRLKDFTPESTAMQTLRVYQSVIA